MGLQTKTRQRWKLSARELMAPVLVPGESWSPLDGTPCPEYIPEQWDGVHVSVRLIEGFKTLGCLPERDRHKQSASGFWPETWAEWGDELAQVTADHAQREIDAKIRNKVRSRPSAQDVGRMDIVLMWPANFVAHKSVTMARIVQAVAYMRAKEYDLEKIARKLRLGPRHVRRINRDGLDIIAGGLRRISEPVF